MKPNLTKQTKALGSIFIAIIIETALCIGMIHGLKVSGAVAIFKEDFLPKNLDTYIGTAISMLFLVSIFYLIFQYYKVAASVSFKSAVIIFLAFIIGWLGYSLCFASVYWLHGVNECEGSFLKYLLYSSYLALIKEYEGVCKPNEFNTFIPFLQILGVLGSLGFITIMESLEPIITFSRKK